jgi:hypothetical protein
VAEETRVTQAVKPYHVMQDGKNQALFLIANIPLQELAVTYQRPIFLYVVCAFSTLCWVAMN